MTVWIIVLTLPCQWLRSLCVVAAISPHFCTEHSTVTHSFTALQKPSVNHSLISTSPLQPDIFSPNSLATSCFSIGILRVAGSSPCRVHSFRVLTLMKPEIAHSTRARSSCSAKSLFSSLTTFPRLSGSSLAAHRLCQNLFTF